MAANKTYASIANYTGFKVTYSQVSQSIENNTSVIRASVQQYSTDWTFNKDTSSMSVTVNGTTRNFSVPAWDWSGANSRSLGSTDFTVTHTEGKRTFSVAHKYSKGSFTQSSSGDYTADAIPQVPNAPGLTATAISRSQIKLSWTSNMNVTWIRYSMNNGGWVQSEFSSRNSGSLTISGIPNGAYRTFYIQVWGPGGWSPSSVTRGATTYHVSSLSSISAAPVKKTSTNIKMNYSQTQTGGSTTVEYKVGNGNWLNMPSSKTITGLASGTTYSIALRARNSSGEYNTYNAVSATTYTTPIGYFGLSSSDKKSIKISLSGVVGANTYQYSLDGGGWVSMLQSGGIITGLTPGSYHTVSVKISDSISQLETVLSSQSITLSNLLDIWIWELEATSTRNTITATAGFMGDSEMTAKGGTFEIEVNDIRKTYKINTSRAVVVLDSSFGLKSGIKYIIKARAYDHYAEVWNGWKIFSVKTADFKPPTASASPNLTNISCNLSYGGDSYYVLGWIGYTLPTPILVKSGTYSLKATRDANGSSFLPNTNYDLSVIIRDEFGDPTIISVRSTTRQLPSITAPSSISVGSPSSANTTLTTSFSNSLYDYKIVYTGGSGVKPINYSQSFAAASSVSKSFSQKELAEASSSTSYSLKGEVYFIEDGVTSPSTSSFYTSINLSKDVITMPAESTFSLVYSPVVYNGSNALYPSSLLSDSLNTATLTIGSVPAIPGGTLSKMWVEFNGKKYSGNNSTRVFQIGPEVSFGANKTATVAIEDNRGVVNRRSFTLLLFDYNRPRININSIDRGPGFSTTVFLENMTTTISKPAVRQGSQNQFTDLTVRIREGTSTTYGAPQTIMTAADMNNESTHSNVKLKNTNGTEVFANNKAYFAWFQTRDTAGRVAEVKDVAITSGRPDLFIDSTRGQVGVGTTTPRGEFEVGGDAYAERHFSLNGIYYNPGDYTDK